MADIHSQDDETSNSEDENLWLPHSIASTRASTIKNLICSSKYDELHDYLVQFLKKDDAVINIICDTFDENDKYNKNILTQEILKVIVNYHSKTTGEKYLSICSEYLWCAIILSDMQMIEDLFELCQVPSNEIVNYLHRNRGFDEQSFQWLYKHPSLMPDDVTWMLINAIERNYEMYENINNLLVLYQPSNSDYDTNYLFNVIIDSGKNWVLEYILSCQKMPITISHFIYAVKRNRMEMVKLMLDNGFDLNNLQLEKVYTKPSVLIDNLIALKSDYNLDPFNILVGVLCSNHRNIDKILN